MGGSQRDMEVPIKLLHPLDETITLGTDVGTLSSPESSPPDSRPVIQTRQRILTGLFNKCTPFRPFFVWTLGSALAGEPNTEPYNAARLLCGVAALLQFSRLARSPVDETCYIPGPPPNLYGAIIRYPETGARVHAVP